MLESSTLRAYFSELGLKPSVADVYLVLHSRGPIDMETLAAQVGVSSRRVKQISTKLQELHLVVAEKQHGKTVLKAGPIANLHILVNKKEQEVKHLQDKLWVIERLLASNSLSSPATRVQFYEGAEGLRQMFWNETYAKSENLAILYENMQNRAEKVFFDQWVHQCNEKNMKFRGIIGGQFIESQKKWYAEYHNERLKNWQARYIAPEVFTITHSQIIYDNIVAYYLWKDTEVFGIEIYNQQIADASRSMFEMLWAQSIPVDDVTGAEKHEQNAKQASKEA